MTDVIERVANAIKYMLAEAVRVSYHQGKYSKNAVDLPTSIVDRLANDVAQAAIAALVQPISEAPKDGTDVLLLDEHGFATVATWDEDGYWVNDNCADEHGNVGALPTFEPTRFVYMSAFQKGKDDDPKPSNS